LLLLFVLARSQASQVAEHTIKQIGLEKEDVKTHPRKVAVTLKQHPREARQLEQIVRENVPSDLLEAA